jgi:zinc transporter, ZIP family
MIRVMLLALLPFVGNFSGAVLAETLSPSAAWRNRALHAAAGIVFAVVAVEIMPEALDVLSGWQIAVAFLVGGAIYLTAQTIIERRTAGDGRMWMIYLAVATDLFGDGLLIGSGTAVAASLGLTLAVGQVLADFPEGAATTITFQANEVPRRKRLLLAASFLLPVVGGAALSYLTLRNQSEGAQMVALVATSGLFAVAVFEDMITEAHDASEDTRTSTAFLLLGFAAFTLVSAGLG